ncbi:helix-turn-helix domain-containing protein [Streptococcus alactolyticus]|uniref:helix-turn-helix domain-containing protein n=1 Tax=Streptococcus alactolyticus TaxID=29389 RepID=UPI003F9AE23F
MPSPYIEQQICTTKIAQLRHHLNLSLVAFSKPLGCSPTQIKRMEIGTVIPSEDILERICDKFKIGKKTHSEGVIRRVGLSDSQLCLIENGTNKLSEKRAVILGEALEVGVEWLLHGKERNKHFPADRKMMEWLKNHPKIREKIWKMMEN